MLLGKLLILYSHYSKKDITYIILSTVSQLLIVLLLFESFQLLSRDYFVIFITHQDHPI